MERRGMKVSELNNLVKTMLEGEPLLRDAWIEGEISNFRAQSSGHYYFSLKDEQAQIRCVMFAGKARMLRFRPQDEQKVLLCGSVSLYERDGQYQLIVSQMEPLGIGALAKALEQLKERLANEGLFAMERKRPLPYCPRVVGIVTSPSGAALRDMVQILRRRYPKVRIVLAPSLVQGEGAAEQVAAGIALLNQMPEVDVIIVGRGGGSLEDLWCFNEEIVARAIVASALPVVSAVGHETDVTIADLVADLRAPTPSAAAELVVPEIALLERDIAEQKQRLQMMMQNRLRSEQEHLASLQNRLDPEKLLLWATERRQRLEAHLARLHGNARNALVVQRQLSNAYQERFLDPRQLRHWVGQRRQQVTEQTGQMNTAVLHHFKLAEARLASNAHKLQLLSPLKTLARGYATVREAGTLKIVSSVRHLRAGDDIAMEFVDGQAEARILHVIPKEEADNG